MTLNQLKYIVELSKDSSINSALLQALNALLPRFFTLAFFSFSLLLFLVHLCQQLYQGRFQNLCSNFSSFDAQ